MGYTPLVDTIFSGNPRVPTADPGDNDTTIANTAFVTAATSFYVPKEGGVTLTGDLTFGENADIIMDNTSVLTLGDVDISRADADALTLGAGDQLRVQQDPVHDNDLARKAYVDSVAMGLDVKASVRVASQADLDLSAPGAEIDGVALNAGDRVLVKAQAAASDNGIYVFDTDATPMVRAADADADAEVTAGMFTFVEEGTNGDQGWVLVSDNPIALGADDLNFAQFSNAIIVSTLDSLTDVDVTDATSGAMLYFDGANWQDTTTLTIDEGASTLQVVDGLSQHASISTTAALGNPGMSLMNSNGDESWVLLESGKMRIQTSSQYVPIELGRDTYIAEGDLYLGEDQVRLHDSSGDLKVDANIIAGDSRAFNVYANQEASPEGAMLTTDGLTLTNGSYIGAQVKLQGDDLAIWTDNGTVKFNDDIYVQSKAVFDGGQRVKVSTVLDANYTADLVNDYLIRCDSSAGAMTITLPAAHQAGDCLVIKDVAGAAEENHVTIAPDSCNIEGEASFDLTINHQSVMVVSDGTDWIVV